MEHLIGMVKECIKGLRGQQNRVSYTTSWYNMVWIMMCLLYQVLTPDIVLKDIVNELAKHM